MNTLENYFNDEQRTKQELNHLTSLDSENIKQKYGQK